MPGYKVFITTSGTGSRLGELTKFTNKALVRLGKKPVISYIIESYPKDTPLVIATGYYGEQVEDFVKMAYPERPVEFVRVDKFEGPGSSLGYSMSCAAPLLQCPFIFHACDTIVTEPVPPPDVNWVGGYIPKPEEFANAGIIYRTHKLDGNKLMKVNDKNATDFESVHIGLIGVKDHRIFCESLDGLLRSSDPNNASWSDVHVIEKMLDDGIDFLVVPFATWHDIGNAEALCNAREKIADHFDNLDKVDESIFLFDDFVIKFFYNKEIVKNRIARAYNLKGLVPEIEKEAPNFYRYGYVKGELYSRVVDPADFSNFLNWAKANLWKEVKEVEDSKFKELCRDFYDGKTKARVKKFLTENSVKDEAGVINGDNVPTLEEMLAQIDFQKISDAEQRQFHGDLILDNILKTKDGYCLLDWRQDFNGLLKAGDVYYDIGKLNHNLTVNHDIIYKNLFTIKISGNSVACDIMRKEELVACEKVLLDFVKKEGYDPERVKLITALIWLNMSPLHHHPFNLFLYYFGKWNLWRTIQGTK